jgi:phosphopantothenoylcysteine decarboxylase/phosphopantothenate--cysteine ligase
MNVVLGVSGSIAAYRAADLARELMRAGHTVRVCLSDAAQQFVTPLLFETLTGHPCLTSTFTEPIAGQIAHIDWAKSADLIVVAPATANTINRLANGIGDDMLTSLILAATCPILLAPAMHPEMYRNIQDSVSKLIFKGVAILEPTEGDVASGETGQGKLAPVTEIAETALAILGRKQILGGKRVLITSGPTQEPIDDVRFLTNRSSGKMGAALAKAALWMGAEVTVVAGPQSALLPRAANVIHVRTAREMLAACENENPDLVIAAAAVADYRPADPVAGKIRRSSDPISLALVPNPDIVATLAGKLPRATVVAFAAEPSVDLAVAREKMTRKGVDAMAVNDISDPAIGFESDVNQLTLLYADGRTEQSPRESKLAVALWLLEKVALQRRDR